MSSTWLEINKIQQLLPTEFIYEFPAKESWKLLSLNFFFYLPNQACMKAEFKCEKAMSWSLIIIHLLILAKWTIETIYLSLNQSLQFIFSWLQLLYVSLAAFYWSIYGSVPYFNWTSFFFFIIIIEDHLKSGFRVLKAMEISLEADWKLLRIS